MTSTPDFPKVIALSELPMRRRHLLHVEHEVSGVGADPAVIRPSLQKFSVLLIAV